ncbi:hypothetical protein CHUAL_002272 [Chamberlinius hualienensis]
MALNVGKNSPIWFILRHHVIPTIFVFGIPVIGFLLVLFPRPGGVAENFNESVLLGNKFSWAAVGIYTLWAILWLKIPSKTFYGPPTPYGYKPPYASNGFLYFVVSTIAFAIINYFHPNISEVLYDNMPQLLGTLNIVALSLCLYLWINGRNKTVDPVLRTRLPFIFEFYRGMELHPKLLGVDVKQLVNCRIGLGLWHLLPIAFLITSFHRNGYDSGILVSVILQFVYLAKFYWWETGYFTTLDITLDRAGFYLSWGCLNVVPGFYTFASYYLVSHPSLTRDVTNYTFLILGLLSIYINYSIDRQKELFIETKGDCKFWGKPAKCIEGNYKNRPIKLMASGYWGIARHLNYVFEMLAGLFWNIPAFGYGFIPFIYSIYLLILLVHRIYRDEDKCQAKYGPYWKKYCNAVPYRLIPHIY